MNRYWVYFCAAGDDYSHVGTSYWHSFDTLGQAMTCVAGLKKTYPRDETTAEIVYGRSVHEE